MTNPLSKPEPAPVRAEMIDAPEWIRVAQDGSGAHGGFWTCAAATETSPKYIRADLVDKRMAALERDLAIKDAFFSVETEQHVIWMERYLAAEAELARIKAGTEDGGVRALVKALRAARQFIVNGIELGFIRMPDGDVPDPAHEMLPAIDAALNLTRST